MARHRLPAVVATALALAAYGVAGKGCQQLDPPAGAQTASNGKKRDGEVRGVWAAHIQARYSEEEYASLLRKNNVNVVYLSVYNDGRPRWNSAAYARAMGVSSGEPSPDGSDLTQRSLVETLRAQGIAVVAWVESGLALGANSDEFAARNPMWIQKDSTGQSKGEEHPEFGGLRFLSPAHPDAMAYFSEAMAELAHPRYGFDGIQLERVRYTRGKNERYMGYEEATKSRMQSGGMERTRRVHATNALKLVVSKIRAANPNLIVSVGADGAYAVDRFDQPWPDWIKDGLVDHVEVQAYGRSLGEFQAHFYKVQAFVGAVKDRITLGYRAMDQNDAAAVETQVRFARNSGWKNVALFGDSAKSYYADDNVKAHGSAGHVWASWVPHPFLDAAAPALVPMGAPGAAEGDITTAPAPGSDTNAQGIGTAPTGKSFSPAANAVELTTSFAQGTSSLKSRPIPDSTDRSIVVCVLRPGGVVRAKAGTVGAGLGTKAFVSLELAEPVLGCSDARNLAGARVHVWGEHFGRK